MEKLLTLFRTKPMTSVDVAGSKLKRCLTAFDLTLLGIGCIIGTGIFVLTGIVAATQTGPAIVISFAIAGLVCAFAALSYAELAGSIGGCGSAYGYCYTAFGEIVAWIIGWALILEYGVAVAAVANGWSGYFQNILGVVGITIPKAYAFGPHAGGMINLPAFGIVITLMCLLIAGVKHGIRLNNAMVFIKLFTIAVFIAVASQHIHKEYWTPFIPFGWYGLNELGKPIGILGGSALVFFAYIGFDAVSTAAEEAKDPQKDLPIGILSSLLLTTVLYIIVAGLLTGIVPYHILNVDSPISYALSEIGVSWASALVATGAIAGITTVMLVLFFGLTRIIFAMGRDGLLPLFLSNVNERTQTPVTTIVISGSIIALIAGFFPLDELAELVNIGTLLAFFVVCIGVIVLRVKRPEMNRPFRIPLGWTIPILGALSVACLGYFLSDTTWSRFFLWQAFGLIIYFCYSISHSKLIVEKKVKSKKKKGTLKQRTVQGHKKRIKKKAQNKRRTIHGRKKVKKTQPWKR
ncbi:MAG: amino acid permease [Candidatus Paceibacterota bacterium]|jgi:APA family basic amino acid/polyamine antiporter|nr:amino acid permease [Candidatus Paceibacterota bacterium]